MGEKSTKKKQYILERAREVFREKGFKKVTMKDIVEACGISRGGLYFYYPGTTELFLDVLRMEQEETDDVFSGRIGPEDSPVDILILFLIEQKREMLRKKQNLSMAAYEFFAVSDLPKKENLLRKQFDSAVKILHRLIEYGVENGDFCCQDPLGTARNIMLALEGLKIAALTMGISEKTVDRELLYIMRGLTGED